MDLDSPKSEPEKSYEKPNTEKAEKDEIASKPDDKTKNNKNDYKDKKIEGSSQKPKDKPKNKIEPRKIDPKKEPKNKIQHSKIDPQAQPRNKIERRRIDIQKEPMHKIQRQKLNPLTPSRNKIERPTLDLSREPKNKITLPKLESKDMQNFDTEIDIDIDNTPSIQNIKNDILKLEKIKEEIKNVDWKNISENWSITTRSNQYAEYRKVSLDPTKEVSKENPLYRHKEWLKKIYNNKNWKLNDRDIANLCGVDPSVIGKWRKKHQISRNLQGEGRWTDKRSGKVYVRVPRDYNHPELSKSPRNKSVYKLEHIYNIEKYLSRHPELELSKKYLAADKHLRTGTEVHHINQIGNDNRIKNLWIYESKKEHAKGELTLYDGLKTLVGTNQIQFRNGKYFLNPDIDSLKTNLSKLGLESKNQINYKDINLVKEEIKKIDWNSISNDWSIQVKKNQFVQKTVKVDPTRDCSKDNLLHHHKEWVKRIVSDNRFNLTDSRLAKLCGITRDTARYWRERMHGIKGKTEWGFERRVDDSDGRIWIKVPKDYANPVVQKEDHHRRFMLEHRYVIEQHLAKHPELEITKKVLKDGKYLKPEAHVHHINMNYQDNRIENLWVFETDKSHIEATKSLYSLAEALLKSGKIRFIEGKYHTDA